MTHMNQRIKVKLPETLNLDGTRQYRGEISMVKSKSPKLRYKPEQRFRYKRSIYRIVFAYRLNHEPMIWRYMLEEICPVDRMTKIIEEAGAGETTPRVVHEAFFSDADAHAFFVDIPARGDRKVMTSQMVAKLQEVIIQ